MAIRVHTNSTCSINIHSLVTRYSAADKLVLRRAIKIRCSRYVPILYPFRVRPHVMAIPQVPSGAHLPGRPKTAVAGTVIYFV